MKKIFALALFAALALVGCNQDNDPATKACNKHDVDLVASEVSGMYYHNYWSNSEDVYDYGVILAGHSDVYDLMTGNVDLLPNNQYLFLDLYSEVASPNYNTSFKIPSGVYTLDLEATTNAGTANAGFTQFVSVNADNETEEIFFALGTITVTDDLIDAMLIDDNGKSYHVQCPNQVVDNTKSGAKKEVEGYPSTLKGDYTVPFTAGNCDVYAENFGDYLIVNKNMWVIYVDEFKANGSREEIMLMVLADTSKGAPVGTYDISGNVANEVALTGYLEPWLGDMNGCWWITMDAKENYTGYAPLKSGNVTITVEGDICSVTVNAVDDLGNKIVGSCLNAPYSSADYSMSNLSTAVKVANHTKREFAPRKVKFSSMVKK